MQADLPDDTFYQNEEHVICLFKNTSFILDFGVDAIGIGFDIEIDHGTICVFAEDVPQDGLTLGEIRVLSRTLIRKCGKCGKCGRMTVNCLSKNEPELGYLEFDWKNNAICQDNYIDSEKDLKTSNGGANCGSDTDNRSVSMYEIASPVVSAAMSGILVHGLHGSLGHGTGYLTAAEVGSWIILARFPGHFSSGVMVVATAGKRACKCAASNPYIVAKR
ncbi:Fc.00g089930.m01.CDS01 [Cosmosporella sp. VM-42]